MTAEPVAVEGSEGGSRLYAHYVLFMLCVANALNTADRALINLLMEPIRVELKATDTAMGFLGGAAFVVFYASFGVPIARWADRGNRRSILALGVLVWSVMTAVCGMAQNFVQMALARAGVGVGEAAGTPTSMSLLADYYPTERRAQMVSLFQTPPTIAGLLLMPLVGVIAEQWGWRAAFYALAAPGVLVAIVMRLTVREPVRGGMDVKGGVKAPPGTAMGAFKAMLAQPAFVWLFIAMSITALGAGSVAGWASAFIMRTQHLTPGQLGAIQPFIGIAGLAGVLIGAFVTPMIVKRTGDQRWKILFPGLFTLTAIPGTILFLTAHTLPMIVLGAMVNAFVIGFRAGPYLTLMLELVPINARGMASAASVIAISVVGGAGGQLIVGILSDELSPTMGRVDALRYALSFAPVSYALGLIPLFFLMRHFGKDGPKTPVSLIA